METALSLANCFIIYKNKPEESLFTKLYNLQLFLKHQEDPLLLSDRQVPAYMAVKKKHLHLQHLGEIKKKFHYDRIPSVQVCYLLDILIKGLSCPYKINMVNVGKSL